MSGKAHTTLSCKIIQYHTVLIPDNAVCYIVLLGLYYKKNRTHLFDLQFINFKNVIFF